MKIGVDLDNTLIDYESAFLAAAEYLQIRLPLSVRSKSQIREFVRSQQGGEIVWQRLQGIAYGRCVPGHAKLYPGVKRFLWRCRELGHSVVIVSHKTKYGHQDLEKVPLREVAFAFLVAHGIMGDQDRFVCNVTYHNTYEEKISFIKKHDFDWFVDDLSEVISDLSGMDGLNRILFCSTEYQDKHDFDGDEATRWCSDWQQIDAFINGEWTYPEIGRLSQQLINYHPARIDKISAGGNGGVYRLALADGRNVKLKIYPVDPNHDRLFSEVIATRGMVDSGINYIGDPLVHDFELGIGLHEWIEGEQVNLVDQMDLESSLFFLAKLHALRNAKCFVDAPLASAACFSGLDIENQIKHRLSQFNSPRLQSPDLESFFNEMFLPTMERLVQRARVHWPDEVGYDKPLAKMEHTLSPSDFGFHNSIRCRDGSLVFTDFEYFGWDDPVKLMSDFSFHPGMNLTEEQLSFWLSGAIKIYGYHLTERLNMCRPLYGLIWCLILLNDFRSEVWERRLLADASKRFRKNKILSQQLSKACALLQEIRQDYLEEFERDGIYEA